MQNLGNIALNNNIRIMLKSRKKQKKLTCRYRIFFFLSQNLLCFYFLSQNLLFSEKPYNLFTNSLYIRAWYCSHFYIKKFDLGDRMWISIAPSSPRCLTFVLVPYLSVTSVEGQTYIQEKRRKSEKSHNEDNTQKLLATGTSTSPEFYVKQSCVKIKRLFLCASIFKAFN